MYNYIVVVTAKSEEDLLKKIDPKKAANIFVPVIHKGEVLKDRYISRNGSHINAKMPAFLSVKVLNPSGGPYPTVSIGDSSVSAHRLAAETFLPIPKECPPGLSDHMKKVWKRSNHDERRAICSEMLQVHHINHNNKDWSIGNLSWLNSRENNRLRGEHYRKAKKRAK